MGSFIPNEKVGGEGFLSFALVVFVCVFCAAHTAATLKHDAVVPTIAATLFVVFVVVFVVVCLDLFEEFFFTLENFVDFLFVFCGHLDCPFSTCFSHGFHKSPKALGFCLGVHLACLEVCITVCPSVTLSFKVCSARHLLFELFHENEFVFKILDKDNMERCKTCTERPSFLEPCPDCGFPPPPKLERQITLFKWEIAEEYMRNHPELTECVVYQIRDIIYKIIRRDGQLLRRQSSEHCLRCGTVDIRYPEDQTVYELVGFICKKCISQG